MAETEIAPCNLKAAPLKFCCNVCGKELSRKQRLTSHLASVHGINDAEQTRYRQYLIDPTVQIPRRTLARFKTQISPVVDPEGFSSQPLNPVQAQRTNNDEMCCLEENNDVNLPELSERSVEETTDTQNFDIDQNAMSSTALNSINTDSCSTENYPFPAYSLTSYVHESSSDSEIELKDFSSSGCDSDFDFSDAFNSSDDESCSKPEDFNVENIQNEDNHLTLLSYMLKYNLNGQASRDLVEMINCISPDPHLRELSLHSVRSSIETSDVTIRDYCEKCFSLFPEEQTIFRCPLANCNSLRYKGTENEQGLQQKKAFFTYLSPTQQIQDILQRDGTWKMIQNYREACKNTDFVTDVATGSLYKRLPISQDEPCDTLLTLLFNTDGIPLYKSSGISIWPLYIVINELPPKMRFSKKNMVLWGVWQGKGKPVFHTYLQPFILEMQRMKHMGFKVDICGEEILVKTMLIAGTMDLQAKAYVTDMTQHNGKHGCLTCEHSGEVVPKGRGHARVFEPKECQQRTTEEFISNAREASATNKTVKGVKGVSALLGLDWFDVVNGLGPDYMHGVLLGVTKKMLDLLFSASYSRKPYSVAAQVKEVDKRLKSMKPTDAISRLPRPLENNIHHMKASELQNWLLFYSIPCLHGILPAVFLDHFALLVEGIYILLMNRISEEQLERAKFVLLEFYERYSDLYGRDNCTLNLHNTCAHLPEIVKLLGPLWAWSCFPFENMNGSILNCVHGTGDVCLQILWVSQAQKRLSVDASDIQDPLKREFTSKMTSVQRKVHVTVTAENCKIVGGTVTKEIDHTMRQKIRQLLNLDQEGKILSASRILLQDTVFYSRDYKRHNKRICHYVLLQSNDGETTAAAVEYYLFLPENNICLAAVYKVLLEDDEPLIHPYVSHLLRIKAEQTSDLEVVRADQIQEKMLLLDGNRNMKCISRLPNLHGLCC